MQKVIIGNVEYSPLEQKGNIKIVILQRGWNMVGRFERVGSDCKLHNASVIRIWGTTKGLGEIAKDGPTKGTSIIFKSPCIVPSSPYVPCNTGNTTSNCFLNVPLLKEKSLSTFFSHNPFLSMNIIMGEYFLISSAAITFFAD